MNRPGVLLLALATSLAAAPTPDQSPRRNDPVLLTFQGRVLRPTPKYPREERLATFVNYDGFDTQGRRVAFLLQMKHSDFPTFRFTNETLASNALLTLDRRTRAFWVVRNKDMISVGRLRRTKVARGEYDWTNAAGESIAAFVPIGGTPFYTLRGGEELRTFLTERLKIQLPEATGLRVRRLFDRLHGRQ